MVPAANIEFSGAPEIFVGGGGVVFIVGVGDDGSGKRCIFISYSP